MDWYYSEGLARKGPVSEESFTELVQAGVVADSTLVWNVNMPDWQPYAAVRSAVAVSAPMAAAGIAFCSQCGRQVTSADLVTIAGRQVCGLCKPALLQQMREGTANPAGHVQYAGFWIRTAAVLIDYVILSAINIAISIVLVGGAALSGDPNTGMAALAVTYLLAVATGMTYEMYFLVKKGATPGKMALGLRVIRVSRGPITWGLAFGRQLGKSVSAMILGFGYFMAGWDPEKRALHDRICDTRVIKG